MTVEITISDRADEFSAKLKNHNLKPIEHKITIKTVEFVPMEEFNKKEIISENYQSELNKYLKEKMFDLHNFLFEAEEKLNSYGLYTFQKEIDVKPHNPLDQFLGLAKLEPSEVTSVLDKILNSPPTTLTSPKRAITDDEIRKALLNNDK